jgi:hypothetical protein
VVDIAIQGLIAKLGTNAGTVVSIFTLIGFGFGAGIYYNNFIRNIEILELKKQNFIEIQEVKSQIQILQIENKELNIKLTYYEKKGKK